ncbi:pseudouridine synthase [Lachnoanaerobaculum umeaense]|uniref:Pseudouridine synthase n=1 Tax=Lachnoanaerobaculum umeaense TaxID=617123 RepID=A0A385PXY1_9FIRM|nr:pseudouridine synthase [Lachnoanaerobaculum umeaense]AYA98960.1 pseudouridine synthase [Lachnoanaerobaculum umeaense]PZW94949.1 pseudouridine synthase [Lachnoanaerobaculum umeaense]
MRLNKFLASIGVCSRREADKAIEAGRVMINGQVVELGATVGDEDLVSFDGRYIGMGKDVEKIKPIIIAFNKPEGLVCTTSDNDGAMNVVDYIGMKERIYPVGRLDKDSSGLLLLTNQGSLTNSLLRAANYHEKEYIVKVNKDIDDAFINKMANGIYLYELKTKTRKCKVKKLNKNTFSIVLTQGLNRQIRRMCLACGMKVQKLNRVRIVNIKLDGLAIGDYRNLSDEEVKKLYKELGIRENG